MDPAGVDALVELICNDAKVSVLHHDVSRDGGQDLLAVFVPAAENRGRGWRKWLEWSSAGSDPISSSVSLCLCSPDFRGRTEAFGATAETHHLPSRNHLDLHVGWGRRWRGDHIQGLCGGNEIQTGNTFSNQRQSSDPVFSKITECQSTKEYYRDPRVTVAEVTALRTVLPHEGLPSFAESESSPWITDPLLILASYKHKHNILSNDTSTET